MKFIIENIDKLPDVAAEFLRSFPDKRKFALYGEIGTGKTTFTKAVCQLLGVEDTVSSPTYAIINEYKAGQQMLRHADLYRLKNSDEAFDINIEEYLDDEDYFFIEWPELIEDWLPDDIVKMYFESQEDGSRLVRIIR